MFNECSNSYYTSSLSFTHTDSSNTKKENNKRKMSRHRWLFGEEFLVWIISILHEHYLHLEKKQSDALSRLTSTTYLILSMANEILSWTLSCSGMRQMIRNGRRSFVKNLFSLSHQFLFFLFTIWLLFVFCFIVFALPIIWEWENKQIHNSTT